MTMRTDLPQRRARSAAAAGSWMALLAATTLGDAAGTLRAEVRTNGPLDDRAYRLVVQSYDSYHWTRGPRTRPVGSVQRAVTADELRRGVHVDLLELRDHGPSPQADHPVVVAWIEAGEPNLEFDGLTARPAPGSVYGVAKRSDGGDRVRISLNRKVEG